MEAAKGARAPGVAGVAAAEVEAAEVDGSDMTGAIPELASAGTALTHPAPLTDELWLLALPRTIGGNAAASGAPTPMLLEPP